MLKYQSSRHCGFWDFLRFKNIYFGCHGNQSSVWNLIPLKTLVELHARNILAKWFRRSCCLKKLLSDARCTTDNGPSQKLTLRTLSSGELKTM